MKSLIVLATLGLVGFTGAGAAQANDDACAPRRDHHRPRHEMRYRHPAPPVRVERCWIAPRYEQRIVSYDHCGRPVYQTVCVAEGYWGTRACD